MPGRAVAAAANGEREPLLAPEHDDVGDFARVDRPDDCVWPAVELRKGDQASPLVLRGSSGAITRPASSARSRGIEIAGCRVVVT